MSCNCKGVRALGRLTPLEEEAPEEIAETEEDQDDHGDDRGHEAHHLK